MVEDFILVLAYHLGQNDYRFDVVQIYFFELI